MTGCRTDSGASPIRAGRIGRVGRRAPALALAAGFALAAAPAAAAFDPPPTDAPTGGQNAGGAGPAAPTAPSAGEAARRIILTPLVRPETIPLPPVEETPAASAAQGAGGSASAAGAASGAGEELARSGLEQPDAAAVGLVAEAGPFAARPDLWAGATRRRLTQLFSALSLEREPRALHALARRLVLAPARPPAPAAGEDPLALLAARFDVLARAGLSHELVALGAMSDPEHVGGDIAWPLVHARLVEGDFAGACALARTADARSHARRWLPVLLLCAARDGSRAELDLTLGMYGEVFGEDALSILALRLADLREHGSSTVPPPPSDSWRNPADPVALAVAAGLVGDSPPVAFVARASGLTLAALLRADRLEPDAKIVTAVKGYEAHLIDAAGLAQALVGYPFPPGTRASMRESPLPPEDAPVELRMLTAARRTAAIVQWLAEADEGGMLLARIAELSARLDGPEFLHLAPLVALPLSALAPQAGTDAHLADILDVLLAADRRATAYQWWQAALVPATPPAEAAAGGEVAGGEAAGAPQPAAAPCPADAELALRGLAFLLAPPAGAVADGAHLAACARDALAAMNGPRAGRLADAAAILLAAMGRDRAAGAFTPLALAGLAGAGPDARRMRPAPAALWAVLAHAVAAGSAGEADLAAVLLAGRSDGLAARAAAVAALDAMGETEAARRLALAVWLEELRRAAP